MYLVTPITGNHIFHFTIQAVFSLVMVNLISLPSLYSSDLTCTVSHGCWLWQMTDDAKEEGEADLAICLDQLSCTMAVASHIWTLSGKVEIVYHLCSCYHGIVQSPAWAEQSSPLPHRQPSVILRWHDDCVACSVFIWAAIFGLLFNLVSLRYDTIPPQDPV